AARGPRDPDRPASGRATLVPPLAKRNPRPRTTLIASALNSGENDRGRRFFPMTHSYRTFRAVRSVYETRGSPLPQGGEPGREAGSRRGRPHLRRMHRRTLVRSGGRPVPWGGRAPSFRIKVAGR